MGQPRPERLGVQIDDTQVLLATLVLNDRIRRRPIVDSQVRPRNSRPWSRGRDDAGPELDRPGAAAIGSVDPARLTIHGMTTPLGLCTKLCNTLPIRPCTGCSRPDTNPIASKSRLQSWTSRRNSRGSNGPGPIVTASRLFNAARRCTTSPTTGNSHSFASSSSAAPMSTHRTPAGSVPYCRGGPTTRECKRSASFSRRARLARCHPRGRMWRVGSRPGARNGIRRDSPAPRGSRGRSQ